MYVRNKINTGFTFHAPALVPYFADSASGPASESGLFGSHLRSPMSTTTPLPTPSSSTDPSLTPTPSSSPSSNNGGGPSSSLYLYAPLPLVYVASLLIALCLGNNRFTFLATLFLLLFVSSAIILRSFILRRRFRRRIEQAILAGVIVPNRPGHRTSRRRRPIGEKPKLWEAWVSPAYGDRWDTIVVRPKQFLYSLSWSFANISLVG
jgi:hypothetical protein